MGKIKYWLIAGFIILLAIVYTAISDRYSTLSRLKSAGENGDVEAQYALGLMYLYGEYWMSIISRQRFGMKKPLPKMIRVHRLNSV